MSHYLLSTGKRTEEPFYIGDDSRPIYSIEELCYYLYVTEDILDVQIITLKVCQWIRDSLELKDLGDNLYNLVKHNTPASKVVSELLNQIMYLDYTQATATVKKFQLLEQESEEELLKRRGDRLYRQGKTYEAMAVYGRLLKAPHAMRISGQIKGKLWYNMGCCYCQMFLYETAMECFMRSEDYLQDGKGLKALNYSRFLLTKVSEYTADMEGIDLASFHHMREELEIMKNSEPMMEYKKAVGRKYIGEDQADDAAFFAGLDQMLEVMRENYLKRVENGTF